MASGESLGVTKARQVIEPHFTVGNLLSVLVTVASIGVAWGLLTSKLDALSEQIHQHIGDTQRHQPILEKQVMIDRQIDSKLAPILVRLDLYLDKLSEIEKSNREVLSILGRRPPINQGRQ